ncbi:MAG: hypothetical protein EOQ92_09155 [Mesorhizobium sp.]|nr:MAG: hypothetical protein EOQ92_09155 [Mesorhizobium sp.]RWK50916.1 MAG: hypothetical protein EOR47_08910 [Mesorhizobium sp.]RWK96476.1 MAG: hypothetical protein EOR53_09200 [Mesorhizobium sp.]TIP56982.1 MAG: hypothetical protein E5X56_22050 [Mesorhizobium sp.]TIQ30964.1 MAG: hypothetical protein E5X54_08205 [Mesorhizobium sp.]
MRGVPACTNSTPSNTPLPSRRCAPIHLPPQQGEKARPRPKPLAFNSASATRWFDRSSCLVGIALPK